MAFGHGDRLRFDVHVTGLGVSSAQGSGGEILAGGTARLAQRLPWAPSRPSVAAWCRPVPGVDPALIGAPRWNLLARRSLAALGGGSPARPALVLASCNGGASDFDGAAWRRAFDSGELLEGTAWDGVRVPVVSGSCASGLQAVYLASLLLEAGQPEVVVLAADVLSPSSQANFEALRVLADSPEAPWQACSTGFVAGEAAVALRLERAPLGALGPHGQDPGGSLGRLYGPALAHDVDGSGLRRALAPLAGRSPDLLLGLGTGPRATDAAELEAMEVFSRGVPLATTLAHFGHSLGASGPLSLSLALLAARAPHPLPALRMPAARAADGRPLWSGWPRPQAAVVSARALSGACAAVAVSVDGPVPRAPSPPAEWIGPAAAGPLMHPVLRRVAAEAPERRPWRPPALIVARLDVPLGPPTAARVGGRLLPSAVLEITPGFVPQLVARAWGFAGPALCLVGGADSEVEALVAACRSTAGPVALVGLRGDGEDRDVEWQLRG